MGAVATFTMDYINKDLSEFFKSQNFNWFTDLPLPHTTYIIAYVLGILPLFKYLKENNYLIYVLISSLIFGAIFLRALDWGRFIYLYFSCLYILYFLKHKKNKVDIDLSIFLLFVIYIFSWKNSPCCSINLFEINNFIFYNLHITVLILLKIYKEKKVKDSLMDNLDNSY